MTDRFAPVPRPEQPRPRLALMGEFSAGKSTLSNLLLGGAALPVRVTATRLPPVWISHCARSAVTVDHAGQEMALDPACWGDISPDTTRMIRLSHPSETLEICDLIDMPGISDPNLPQAVWSALLDEIDTVVWCTQATQAWRQSEAAAWAEIAPRTRRPNLLLVTQIDRLRTDRDRARVLTRVRRETEGLFDAVYPISILDAIRGSDDESAWNASGAAEFVDHLVDILLSPASHAAMPEDGAHTTATVTPKRVRVLTRLRGRTERPPAQSGATPY